MMADRWYLPKQGGSEEQHVLVTRKEVCRPDAISRYLA
jgi:hypothetical protein